MSLSDSELKRIFRLYNKRYYNGELEDVDVLYAPLEGCCGWVQTDRAGDVITINPKHALDFNAVKITLLHEMAHIYVAPYPWHGKTFQREIARLFVMGAYRGLL